MTRSGKPAVNSVFRRSKRKIPGGVTTRDSSCAKGDSNPHTVKY